MSAEIVVFDPTLPITKSDLDNAHDRRKLLKEFIQNQMVDGVDFGIIPGCPKPTLFKPGAEKLAQLFGLGVRISMKDKEIDLHSNFAMFSYTMETYHLRTGTVISQCEGSCNSHEIKYRTRKRQGAQEETPIGDIMNTLMKMAQKRGYVGAIMQATGASDFYTQDIDDPADAAQNNIKPPPTVAKASVGVKSAKSTDENSLEVCSCGNKMMISKFPDPNFPQGYWYCGKCKEKRAMA